MDLLRRDFLIQDLMDVLEESDIDGVVTVQARQALAETRWLLDLARTHDVVGGVVAWVALTDPKVDSASPQICLKDSRKPMALTFPDTSLFIKVARRLERKIDERLCSSTRHIAANR